MLDHKRPPINSQHVFGLVLISEPYLGPVMSGSFFFCSWKLSCKGCSWTFCVSRVLGAAWSQIITILPQLVGSFPAVLSPQKCNSSSGNIVKEILCLFTLHGEVWDPADQLWLSLCPSFLTEVFRVGISAAHIFGRQIQTHEVLGEAGGWAQSRFWRGCIW